MLFLLDQEPVVIKVTLVSYFDPQANMMSLVKYWRLRNLKAFSPPLSAGASSTRTLIWHKIGRISAVPPMNSIPFAKYRYLNNLTAYIPLSALVLLRPDLQRFGVILALLELLLPEKDNAFLLRAGSPPSTRSRIFRCSHNTEMSFELIFQSI